jgi:Flp pilus assembly protein protease CpaA
MGLDLSFFSPGQNPLLDAALRPGLERGTLAPLLIALCALLGYAAYTDFFRGWIIPDTTNGIIALVAVVSAPFIFRDMGEHWVWAAVAAAVILALGFIGVFMMGDTKLYIALALLLGPAVLPLMLFSWILVMTYAPVYIIRARQRNRGSRRRAKTHCPLGPAISMAFPVTLYVAGLNLSDSAALLGVIIGSMLISLLFGRKVVPAIRRAELRATREEEQQELYELLAPTLPEPGSASAPREQLHI